jgi:peptidoglycan hydrolase-like protein with peptidoglycan-binding domain
MTAPAAVPTDRPRADLRLRALVIATVLGLVAVVLLALPDREDDTALPTAGANPVTPGVFTGLGFDQCNAPTQRSMTAWRKSSPFRAVGIYIAGYSRACREQPDLTPTWIATQLAAGWHLLPITLGPQASCQPRFPRYGTDYRINSRPDNDYAAARTMGTNEASKTVAAAKALGLVRGSTMFYDLEGFDYTNARCRESALRFMSAWTVQIRKLGYRSGVYSSAGSGIKLLERQRVSPLPNIVLPDQLWLARYDGKANTSATQYLSDAGWVGNRVKQFQGGHNETWGGVTINIDRNYLDLRSAPKPAAPPAPPAPTTSTAPAPASAPAETHCGGVRVDLRRYVALKKATRHYRPQAGQVIALKCLLKERATFRGGLGKGFGPALVKAVESWRKERGMRVKSLWTRAMWMELLASGKRPNLRPGTASKDVRDVQRALNAANLSARLPINGTLDARTQAVLKQWKTRVGLRPGGLVAQSAWRMLASGRF